MTFVIIRPSYVAALNSPVAAAICSLFEHWSVWKAHHGPDLWIYKKQDELQADLFGMFGVKQIRAALSDLVSAGILSRRTNPHRATDRTFQYLYKPNRLAELLRQIDHDEAKGEADRLQTVEERLANGPFAASSLEQIRLPRLDSAKAADAQAQARPAAAAAETDADLHSSMRVLEGADREQAADEGLDAARRAAQRPHPPAPSPSSHQNAGEGEITAAISGVFGLVLARQLIEEHGAEKVERALTVAGQRGARNPGGFALKLLRDADPALCPHPPAPSPCAASRGRDGYGEGEIEAWLAARRAVDAPTEPPAPDPARDAWRVTHAQLEIQLDRGNFETWVRGAEFVRAEGDLWTIRAAHSMACDQLRHRLYKDIRRVLSDVVGRKVEIEFVIAESRKGTSV